MEATRIRVRYCECDPMGVAHHASYLPWLEIARTDLLRATGVTYAQLEADGVFLVVTDVRCRYRRPVYYDDVVEIRARVSELGRVRIRHAYDLLVVESARRGSNEVDRPVFSGETALACVGRDGRVRELPAFLSG